jgi:hypothetical protein
MQVTFGAVSRFEKLFDRLLARAPDVPPVPGDELAIPTRQADKALRPTRRRKVKARSRKRPRATRG